MGADIHPAHSFTRGNSARSMIATRAPPRARKRAHVLPAGPPPTTIASYSTVDVTTTTLYPGRGFPVARRPQSACEAASPRPHGDGCVTPATGPARGVSARGAANLRPGIVAPRRGMASSGSPETNAMPRTVWMPLPDRDFDVTEVAVPWQLLTDAGHEVIFATEDGATPAADPRLLTGVLFGQLGARPDAIACYRAMEQTAGFQRPRRWREVDVTALDALLLAGGHAPGMKQYLGSEPLQRQVAAFFATGRPVAAICHGVLLAARATDEATGRSVLHARRTTCLPKYMERSAFWLTAWRLGRYYRTYPAYVEDEVRAALASPAQFERGPRTLTARGTADDDGPAFVVEDGAYVSGRWPGDAYLLARRLCARLADDAPAA